MDAGGVTLKVESEKKLVVTVSEKSSEKSSDVAVDWSVQLMESEDRVWSVDWGGGLVTVFVLGVLNTLCSIILVKSE